MEVEKTKQRAEINSAILIHRVKYKLIRGIMLQKYEIRIGQNRQQITVNKEAPKTRNPRQ